MAAPSFPCRNCDREICKVSNIFRKEGATNEVIQKRETEYGRSNILVQVFVNPFGNEFEVITTHKADVNRTESANADLNPWFEGYQWSLIKCRGCGYNLGWSYQKRNKSPEFYGLIWKIDEGKTTDRFVSDLYDSGGKLCQAVDEGKVPLRVGDRLEVTGFAKSSNPVGLYQHWGVVYQVSPEPLMMHFTVPGGSHGVPGVSAISSASASASDLKGAKGNAGLMVNKIKSFDRKLRVNNQKDSYKDVLGVNKMKGNMRRVLDDPSLVGQYNLIKNNCEHFANYIRYGISESDQINAKSSYLPSSWQNPPMENVGGVYL